MIVIEALLLSLSLCVDSLVVSATTAFHSKISFRRGILMALIFGFCQGAFPLMGALIGDVARSFIESVDHWVAFGLLLFVGGKMIVDGIRNQEEEVATRHKVVNVGLLLLVGGKMILDAIRNREEPENRNRPVVNVGTMFLLGIATSIDAFAVGIGLGLEHAIYDVLWTVAMIGGTTLIVSLIGVHLGRRNIPVPERAATIIAGVVLIGLGTKILLEHLIGL